MKNIGLTPATSAMFALLPLLSLLFRCDLSLAESVENYLVFTERGEDLDDAARKRFTRSAVVAVEEEWYKQMPGIAFYDPGSGTKRENPHSSRRQLEGSASLLASDETMKEDLPEPVPLPNDVVVEAEPPSTSPPVPGDPFALQQRKRASTHQHRRLGSCPDGSCTMTWSYKKCERLGCLGGGRRRRLQEQQQVRKPRRAESHAEIISSGAEGGGHTFSYDKRAEVRSKVHDRLEELEKLQVVFDIITIDLEGSLGS